jgi:aldose 1-epimerase
LSAPGGELGSLLLTAGSASLTLVPRAGGRASSLVVDGLELLAHDADVAVGWGWYPMAPWPGRLHDNAIVFGGATYPMPVTHDSRAIHGTVYDVPWEVERVEPGDGERGAAAVLGVELTDPWPWAGRVRQTWRLTEASVETVLEVSTHGEEFPAELGWHPWFRRQLDRGESGRVDLPAEQMFERGPDWLPTGALVPRPPGPYDDAFPLPHGRVGVTWPGALSLSCETDCAYVVVYDFRPSALCVEPQTALPNGINEVPGVVRRGKPRTARAVWSWSPAPRSAPV